MTTTNELKDILIAAVKATGLSAIGEIRKNMHLPVSKSSNRERVVIVSNATDNAAWQKAYCRICIYVPDLDEQDYEGAKTTHAEPNVHRLKELETIALGAFSQSTYGKSTTGDNYLFKVEGSNEEADPDSWSHFLNIRIKFEILNLKKL